MFQLRELERECSFRGAFQQAPYRGAAIALWGIGSDRVTGLKGKVLLDVVYGRKVVVFDFTKLQKAAAVENGELLVSVQPLDKIIMPNKAKEGTQLTFHMLLETRQPEGQ